MSRSRIFRSASIHSKENFLLLFSQIFLEFPLLLFILSKILGGCFFLINRVSKWQSHCFLNHQCIWNTITLFFLFLCLNTHFLGIPFKNEFTISRSNILSHNNAIWIWVHSRITFFYTHCLKDMKRSRYT